MKRWILIALLLWLNLSMVELKFLPPLKGEACSVFVHLPTSSKKIPSGFVLYPIVFFFEVEIDPKVRAHENVHCLQVREIGWLKFYSSYLSYYIKNRMKGMSHEQAYASIPYETLAYIAAGQEDYLDYLMKEKE